MKTKKDVLFQRIEVIKKAMIVINQSNPRKNYRATLVKLDDLIKTYPVFESEGEMRQIDMFVSLSITKIHFGLLGHLPPKNAIEQAFRYLAKSYNLSEEKKGKAL